MFIEHASSNDTLSKNPLVGFLLHVLLNDTVSSPDYVAVVMDKTMGTER